MIPLITQDQYYTVQDLQRSPILQISNWSGTFFAVSYSKRALTSDLDTNPCVHILSTPNPSRNFVTVIHISNLR